MLRSVPLASFLVGLAIAPAQAQSNTIVVPNGMATAEGSTSNGFPWGRGGTGLRIQNIYGAGNFTLQNINGPIHITRLRWRPDGGVSSLASSYPVGATVTLSTCPLSWSAPAWTFASQTGADATVVFSGPLSWPAAAAQPGPAPFLIDLPLTTPFLYDPTLGDLTIDIDLPIQPFTGSTGLQLDVHTGGTQCSRVYLSSGYVNGGPNASATTNPQIDHGVVVEITYGPASATVATRTLYGNGCYDRASASFYELFGPGLFNLSNTSILMTPTGAGYVVVPGSNQWWTPVGANLALGDDQVSSALPLPFTFAFPGGTTNNLYASSNGFVWLRSSLDSGCCDGAPPSLLSLGPRFCALWHDLNPTAGGNVVYDAPSNQVAYLTYTNVPEYGTSNQNTFQFVFQSSGAVEMRWQSCTVMNHSPLVGWSPGGGARDPGSVSISTSLPIVTQPDLTALALNAASRPVTGTGVTLITSNVPAGTAIGAAVFSLVRLNPGTSLAPLGMPGCFQYTGLDFANLFVPTAGTGSFPFTVPNNGGLTGFHFYCQSATFSAGVNALGVLASNGIDFMIGTL